MKRVTVIPIQKESVQGRDKPSLKQFTPGQGFVSTGETVKYPKRDGITPMVFLKGADGKYKTGLEELIRNPFKGVDPEEVISQYGLGHVSGWRELLENKKDSDKIDLQTYYEILDGVEPGTYHNRPSYDMVAHTQNPMLKPGPKTQIEMFRADVNNTQSTVFTDQDRLGRMAIQIVKNQPNLIALDRLSKNNSIHDWYLGEETDSATEKARKNKLIDNAIFELIGFKKAVTPFEVYKLAVQLKEVSGSPLIKGEVSGEILDNRLSDYIKKEDRGQEFRIEAFLDLLEIHKKQHDLFDIGYMIQQGINERLLTNRDGNFYWLSKVNNQSIYKWSNQQAFQMRLLSELSLPLDENNLYKMFKAELEEHGIKTE